ncbi:hypothetical protein GP486_006900, partial [Trichoglossum hirsutum]
MSIIHNTDTTTSTMMGLREVGVALHESLSRYNCCAADSRVLQLIQSLLDIEHSDTQPFRSLLYDWLNEDELSFARLARRFEEKIHGPRVSTLHADEVADYDHTIAGSLPLANPVNKPSSNIAEDGDITVGSSPLAKPVSVPYIDPGPSKPQCSLDVLHTENDLARPDENGTDGAVLSTSVEPTEAPSPPYLIAYLPTYHRSRIWQDTPTSTAIVDKSGEEEPMSHIVAPEPGSAAVDESGDEESASQ